MVILVMYNDIDVGDKKHVRVIISQIYSCLLYKEFVEK